MSERQSDLKIVFTFPYFRMLILQLLALTLLGYNVSGDLNIMPRLLGKCNPGGLMIDPYQ